MEIKIRVYCQYFENYGWYDNTLTHIFIYQFIKFYQNGKNKI